MLRDAETPPRNVLSSDVQMSNCPIVLSMSHLVFQTAVDRRVSWRRVRCLRSTVSVSLSLRAWALVE